MQAIARATRGEILAAWRDMALRRTAAMKPHQLRERLAALLHVSMPNEVTVPETTAELVLLRTDTGTSVRADWLVPPSEESSEFEIVVSTTGLACEECKAPAPDDRRRARLVVEVYKPTAPPQPFDLERLTFRRSNLAERVQDTLAAVRYVSGFAQGRRISLSCHGAARAWCLVAAALAPPESGVRLDASLDERLASGLAEYLNHPGVAYAGGVSVLLRLAGGSGVPGNAPDTMGK